jgi:predicted N-acyltransferase
MWHTRIINTIYDVDEGSWDKIAGGHPQLSHAWQRVLEASAPSYRPRYVLLFDDSNLVASAICPGVQSWQLSSAWARRLMDWGTLFNSSPSSSLHTGLVIRDYNHPASAFDALLDALQDDGRRRQRLFHALTNVNPLLPPSLDQLVSHGFQAHRLLDGNYMSNRWTSFEDYCNSLEGKHRREIRSYQRRARQLGVTVRRSREFAAHGEMLYRLLLNIHRHHNSPNVPPSVGPSIFDALQREQPLGTELILVSIDDQVLAFCLCQIGNGIITLGSISGLDYKRSRKTYAYFLLYYEVIKAAIDYGCSGVYAGLETYGIKSRLGFETIPRHLCLRGTHRWLDRPLSWLLKGWQWHRTRRNQSGLG